MALLCFALFLVGAFIWFIPPMAMRVIYPDLAKVMPGFANPHEAAFAAATLTLLPNGLIVLTERMDHLRSVAMGAWIKSGSRGEAAEINGISHFVEHMVFKGTRNRTAPAPSPLLSPSASPRKPRSAPWSCL